MNLCEKCQTQILIEYGTGRFCSSKCARSFSTSSKRKEISEKARQTLLSANRKTIRSAVCTQCQKAFEYAGIKAKRKFCSKSCVSKATNSNPKNKAAASERMRLRNEKGEFFQSFGRRIKFKNEKCDIQCDSLIEWCALTDLFEKYPDSIQSVSRSSIKIPYVDHDGKERIFIPDLDVTMNDGTTYIYECKSDQFGTSEIWVRYHKESIFKKEALVRYCENQGFIPIWFTQKTRKDLYRKAKLQK